jgi:hypothetical protein
MAKIVVTHPRIANDMMIENVEAWLKGKPINIFRG